MGVFNNKHILALSLCVIVLPMLYSCKTITSLVHDGKTVAKVGRHRLYQSELNKYIPDSASPEDSTRLALQYINSWASEMLFVDMAEKELSKSEKNVDKELEDYRRSLLKYRYEQKYINQRLDTAVTAGQIENYYDSHKDIFKLQIPIVKARFMLISSDSPNREILKKKMASDDPKVRIEADSIAFSSALKYTDFGDQWIDLVRLSREFGIDYGTLLASIKGNYAEMTDSDGNICIAYIESIVPAGDTGPVDYYKERIKDIILSTRKQVLLSGLERDLIVNARDQEDFVIY